MESATSPTPPSTGLSGIQFSTQSVGVIDPERHYTTSVRLWLLFGTKCILLSSTRADYQCLCNYQVETPMFGNQDDSASPVGYLYEFDCKPMVSPTNLLNSWYGVMNEKAISYVKKGDGLAVQVCQGSIPSEDKVTTTSVASPKTTPLVTTALRSSVFTSTSNRPLNQTMPTTAKSPSTPANSKTTISTPMLTSTPSPSTSSNRPLNQTMPTTATSPSTPANSKTTISTLMLTSTPSPSTSGFPSTSTTSKTTTHIPVPILNTKSSTSSIPSKTTPSTTKSSPTTVTTTSTTKTAAKTLTPSTIKTTSLSSSTMTSTNLPTVSSTLFGKTSMSSSSTTTSRTSTSMASVIPVQQVTGQGNLNLCPHSVTRNTDARWIRQYKNFCYEIISDRYEDWFEALGDCRDRHRSAHGTLLEIYTSDIQHFIEQFLHEEGHDHPVWIGLQDIDKEESFDHWETDTNLTYRNFDPNRKNNYVHHSMEDCVLLEPSGLWDDSVCNEHDAGVVADLPGFLMGRRVVFAHSWICQYPIYTDHTTIAPTTTPTQPPIPAVTISGHISMCPKIVRQTADHSLLRQYHSYCYELVQQYEDWYEASRYCSDRGTGTHGRLVEIYSPDIQHFLMQILREEDYKHPVWIGLQDVDKEEQFDHWDSDIPLSYQNFDPNRKDNYADHAQENCVLLEPSGFWDDSVCNEVGANQADADGHPNLLYRHPWICQYPIRQLNIFG